MQKRSGMFASSRAKNLLVLLLAGLLVSCGGGDADAPTAAASASFADDDAPAVGLELPGAGVTAAESDGPITVQLAAQVSVGQFSVVERDRLLADGLKIWRAQRIDINGINKGACANCHSADGIELALWRFLDDDVIRRAHIDGVSLPEQRKLVDYFAALRQKYGVTTMRSVANDRPFQPKGTPFNGSTFSRRDLQFAYLSMRPALPTLMTGTIDNLAEALQAKQELMDNNPLDTRIGIPLPRMSEDCVRGGAHCSLNDWMADVPRIPKPELATQWFALNDKYITSPTDENFRELLVAIDSMTVPWLNADETTGGAVGELGTQKFRSTQVLQHVIRRQQLGLFNPGDDLNPLAPVRGLNLKRPNFPFVVGDVANDKAGTPLRKPGQLPVFVRTSLGESTTRTLANADITAQKGPMRTPWWWVGFMLDTQLNSGTGQEYFLQTLADGEFEGYPFHALYARARHAASVPYRNNLNNTDDPSLTAFSRAGWANVAEFDRAYLFDTPEARRTYRRAAANWVRMYLFLLREQLDNKGVATFLPDDLVVNVCSSGSSSSIRNWVADTLAFEPAKAALTMKLYNEVISLAKCAQPRFSSGYRAGNGKGLKVEWFRYSDEFNGGGLRNKFGERLEPFIDMWKEDRPTGYFYAYTASIRAPVAAKGNVPAVGSTRASGTVMAPLTADYIIAEGSRAFGRIWLDGKLVYEEVRTTEDKPKLQFGQRFRALPGVTVRLEAGKSYRIVYERYGNPTAGFSLGWKTADGRLPLHAIPSEQLSPPL